MPNQFIGKKKSLYGYSSTQKYVDNFNPIAPNIRRKLSDSIPGGAGGGGTSTPATPSTADQLLINGIDTLTINSTDSLII